MNLREQQAQKTYENIILTAEKILENSSFEELSVSQICENAGISKGGFYHHFPSKDHLLSLLIGRQMGKVITERVKPCLNKKNIFELLKIYIDTMMEYLENNPKEMFARWYVALAEHTEMINGELAQESFQILYSIIEQGKQEGSIREDLDTDFCHAYVNGTLTGIILYGCTFRECLDMKTFAEKSLKLICETFSKERGEII